MINKIFSQNDKYLGLRMKFPFLSYEKYDIVENDTRITAVFHFNLSDVFYFKPTFHFPKTEIYQKSDLSNNKAFQNILFHIGLMELISYWKCACPPTIYIKAGKVQPQQITWLKELYFLGLGEFFYLNGIQTTQDEFVEILSMGADVGGPRHFQTDSERSLIPLGGGKDSSLTLELLDKNNFDYSLFLLSPNSAARAVAHLSKKAALIIDRQLDPLLLQLNKEGFLNGHTPFSSLLSFYSMFAAVLTGSGHIVLSNESSANEPTILNTDINHQYSKSIHYEKNLRDYIAKYIGTGLNYFSFLRPLNEYTIAKLFSRQKEYFFKFKSCNVGSKKNIWCGNCPKCLFTYLILSPFLSQKILTKIFGENLLDKSSLSTLFLMLIGVESEKPFECIGTVEESLFAAHQAYSCLKQTGEKIPYLLMHYLHYFQSVSTITIEDYYSEEHFLPSEFEKILKYEILHSKLS